MKHMLNKVVSVNESDVKIHMSNVFKFDADRIWRCAQILSETGLGPKIYEQSKQKTTYWVVFSLFQN